MKELENQRWWYLWAECIYYHVVCFPIRVEDAKGTFKYIGQITGVQQGKEASIGWTDLSVYYTQNYILSSGFWFAWESENIPTKLG